MLSIRERKQIDLLNQMNRWGLNPGEFEYLVKQHQAARDSEDRHKMDLIEYRLTDINFHTACRLLSEGRYREALEHEKVV